MVRKGLDEAKLQNGINSYIEVDRKRRVANQAEQTKPDDAANRGQRSDAEMGNRVDETQCVEPGPTDTDAEKSKTDSEEDPWGPENRAYLIVETANVTSLVTNQEQMHNRKAHVVAIQEHAASGKEASIAVQDAKEKGWEKPASTMQPFFSTRR